MLKVPAFLLALLCTIACFAQRKISGTVVSGATSQPIAGSSVFLSNTSKGTVTDKEGRFELNDVPAGNHDLIVSSIGYETNVYSFSSEKLPLRVRFELDQKVRELENVVVEPSLEEGWDKWGLTFTDHFIGRTPNAAQCKIKNYKAIRFRFFRKSNRVIAYSDEPLIIENKALGYRISYQLENFEVNFKVGSSIFAGYPLIQAMDENRRNPRSKWQKSRNKSYHGSMMHFMRSLYSNKLTENQFEVRRMVRSPNYERERVKAIYKPVFRINTKGIHEQVPDSNSKDSTAYYERIMKQKDYIETYGREILTADSLFVGVEGASKVLYFPDYLLVTYKGETEDPAYLQHHMENRRPTFQRSYIWLVNGNAVGVDANGNYFPPQELYSMAYWGWDEKIANMIPLDFEPDDE